MRGNTSIAAIFALLAGAAALPAADAPNPAWTKLQTLVGDWKGTYSGAGAEGGGDVRVSDKLVSNGTSLMETLDTGTT
jgi:hypothetical protein